MSRPQGTIGMPSSRIINSQARSSASLSLRYSVGHCLRSRIKGCFIFIWMCLQERKQPLIRHRGRTPTRQTQDLFLRGTIGHVTAWPRPGPRWTGSRGGENYAVFPTAMVKGSGEWAKFRMNEYSSGICGTFPWLKTLWHSMTVRWLGHAEGIGVIEG